MKYLILYILFFSSLFSFLSCNDDNIVPQPEKPFQSKGNIWIPTSMWPDTGNSVHYVSLEDIAVNSNDEIFVATDFAGIFKTSDLGLNWGIINDGLIKTGGGIDSNCFVSALTNLNNDIFCGNSDLSAMGGIYCLSNSEEKWKPKIVWNKYIIITSLEINNGEIFAGCDHGLYISKDGGNSWSDISNGLKWDSLAYVYSIAFDSKANIYICTRNGIYLSDDNGESWLSIGLISEAVLSIAINSKDEIFASLENSRIMFSEDRGSHWKELLNPTSIYIRHIFINLDDLIFLSTSNGIYRSIDNGVSFEQIGLQNIRIEKIIINSKGYMIAGSFRDGLFISKE